jgi:hypothetical protein
VQLDEISELPETMKNARERQNTLIWHGQLSLCPGFFPRLPMPFRASKRFKGGVSKRKANETTLPMYPVTNQMEIPAFHTNNELVR